MAHNQMTSEEWINEWVSEPSVPALADGVVMASVKGGTYACTVHELNTVLAQHYTPSGTKLRKLVIERSNGLDGDERTHQETVEFYADATPVDMAVVLAWYDSAIRDTY